MISAIPAMIPMPIAAAIPSCDISEKRKSFKPSNSSGTEHKKIRRRNTPTIPKSQQNKIASIKPSPEKFFISGSSRFCLYFRKKWNFSLYVNYIFRSFE